MNLNYQTGVYSLLEQPGGYLILGSDQHPDLILDPVVLKVDKQGNLLWRKDDYGSELWEVPTKIIKLSENEFACVGGAGDFSGIVTDPITYDIGFAFMIDSMGNNPSFWYSDKDLGFIHNVAVLPDSSWICVGSDWEYNPQYGRYDMFPMAYRIDKDKNLLWKRKIGGLYEAQFASDIVPTNDGNYIVGGVLKEGLDNIFFTKLTPDGDSIWMRRDTINKDSGLADPDVRLASMDVLSTGSIISVGYTERVDANGTLATFGFLMKLSPDGCLDTLNCWPVANVTPEVPPTAVAVYPNPARDYLTVRLGAYRPDTYIHFYDLTGRLLRRQRLRNSHNVLNISDLPRGVLLYTVESNGGIIIGRGKLIVN